MQRRRGFQEKILRVFQLFIISISLLLSVAGASAQDIPRTASGRPDLQGIWNVTNTAAFGLEDHVARDGMPAGLSVVDGGSIPYRPEARAERDANFRDRVQLDPLNNCFLPGTPRIMYLGRPFHIFQTDEHLAITFEWQQVWRLIYTAGQEPLYPGFKQWMGDSRGHWEGDTLVVEVLEHNDRTWFDAAGNFHSDAMMLTERYRLLDENSIEYSVTVEDPEVFTRPWTMRMNLHRQTEVDRILEYQCQAEKEEANGEFERDERTWYPAPIPTDNEPFAATAGIELPQPQRTGEFDRLPDGTPDISGYFVADAGGANYGLEFKAGGNLWPASRGHVVDPADGVLPYQAWARAEADDRYLPHRGYDDPTAHCFVAGVPRSQYVPAPFLILQPPGFIVVLHERMSWRQIRLNDDEFLPDSIRLWMGDSIGRWEEDTLVVESRNFNGKAWLNEAGDVISHAQTVRETFTPVANGRVIYRATVADPISFTRPWTIEMPFNREEAQLLEVACLEDNGDLPHLKDIRDEWRAEHGQE
jgi:hypothetical protein